MQIEDIRTVLKRDGEPSAHTVRALCDELWAVHPCGVDEESMEPLFTVTHRPTGRALTTGVVWDYALELVREIRRRPIQWDFTDAADAKALRGEWREIQAAARKAVGGAWPALPPASDAVDPALSARGTGAGSTRV